MTYWSPLTSAAGGVIVTPVGAPPTSAVIDVLARRVTATS
jgi:hypothetical protein